MTRSRALPSTPDHLSSLAKQSVANESTFWLSQAQQDSNLRHSRLEPTAGVNTPPGERTGNKPSGYQAEQK